MLCFCKEHVGIMHCEYNVLSGQVTLKSSFFATTCNNLLNRVKHALLNVLFESAACDLTFHQ